jgi:hypothetical protein
MSATTDESASAAAIRPFTVQIPEAEIEALRARVAATRWPHKELVGDWSQGVQLAMLQELARYWAADYDWRRINHHARGHAFDKPFGTTTRARPPTSHRARGRVHGAPGWRPPGAAGHR